MLYDSSGSNGTFEFGGDSTIGESKCMIDISVIVPVHNVEFYLRTCIDSILNQTFENFELILIDDGSIDQSSKICDEYAQKSNKVRTIHQNQQGPSAARNKGLVICEGKYITFVDADDYIEISYLENLWQSVEYYGADLVISGMYVVKEGEKPNSHGNLLIQASEVTNFVSKKVAYQRMLEGKRALLFSWGKLYHRKLFQKTRYPEGEIYEDVKIICRIIEEAETIVCTSYTGYFYVQRVGSVTHNSMSEEHMLLLENGKEFWNFIKKYYPDIEYLAKRQYFKGCFFLLEKMAAEPKFKQESKQLKRQVLIHWKYLIFNREASWLERGGTISLLFGVSFYRVIWRFYKRVFHYKS